jgi:hypothetical protein
LVFVYLCDESRERPGNIGRLFGLSYYYDNTGLFYIERQIDKAPMVIGISQFGRMYFTFLHQYSGYVLQQFDRVHICRLSDLPKPE